MITGLLKPSSGIIKIGDVILNNQIIKTWHSLISILSQNFFIKFLNYLQYNSRNDNDINHDKLNNIIKICELEDLILNLEHGLKTMIGDNGIKLSRGQRQRIGLARSLYKDTEIYILDEATNAIDKETEKKSTKIYLVSFSEKTFINVSHNPLLKEYSDDIINMR